MAQRIINLGLTPNDGNGDPIRVGGQKINENFSEIFPLLNNKVRVKMIIPDALSGNGTIKQQTLEYLNSLNPYEVKRDEILIYKLPIFSGTQSMLASDNYLFTSHHYFHKVGAGIFGQGATQLNSNDITDPIISQEASDIVDLGNVNNNISVVVNNSGPYRERVFKGSRSGIDFLYMYVGDEELIGQGAAQTVENDFVDLMNQNINLDSYLTNLDLFDRYTYLQFDNEGSISGLTEEYYLVRLRDSEKYYFITNEGDFLYTKILLKGLGAVDTGDVTTRDVIPGYDMYELLLPSGIGSPQALLEEGHKYWFTFWRYFGSSGSTFTGITTTNSDDINLSGNGTEAEPLKAELTQDVKDEIQTGLEAIDEGNGIGWRLKGRDPDNYGNIGLNAIDLGASDSPSNTVGANSTYSTVGGGYQNEANGTYSSVGGGRQNKANSTYSTVGGGLSNEAGGAQSTIGGGYQNKTSDAQSTIGGGYQNKASGSISTIGGGTSNEANGRYSTVSGGINNLAKTFGEFLGGLWATIKEGNATTWVGTDRIFGIGNGTSASSRSDAFNVYKNGVAELPSVTNALIDASGAKTIPTKEWVQEQAINQQLKITANATVLANWNRRTVFLDGTNLEISVNVSTNELDENTEIYFYNMSDSEVDFKFTVVGGWSLPDDATLEPNGTCILMRVLDEQKLILIGNE